MPYTNTWDDARPPGTELARNIDNEIRALRVDIHERMAEIFVDWEADPIVLKDQYLGKVTNKTLIVPAMAFTSVSGDDDSFVSMNGTDDHLRGVIDVPVGCTINMVEMLSERVTASSGIECRVYRNKFDAATAELEVALIENAAAGKRIDFDGNADPEHADALGLLVASDDYFIARIATLGTSFDLYRFYAIRVTYSTPDVRYTR